MTKQAASSEYVMLNGEVLSAAEAHVPIDDRGLLYGESVFTTIRCYRGAPFRLERHCARLNESLRSPVVDIDYEVIPKKLLKRIQILIERNGCPEAIARFTVTRGSGGGPLPPEDARPLTLLTVRPYAPPAKFYDQGVLLANSSVRRDPQGELGQHKLGSYFPCLLARREALAKGCDEAVIFDTQGNLLECACANLFAVVDGALITPDVTENLLPGIARETVLECAREQGLLIVLDSLTPALVEQAKEMFITNSALEIAPVAGLAEQRFQHVPGLFTVRLMHAYRQTVLREIP